MDSTNSVCSGKSSLSFIVDKPSVLIHKSTMELVILCNGDEVKVIGCICPVIGNLIISDCEGNLIAGSFDDEQNGTICHYEHVLNKNYWSIQCLQWSY